MQAELKQLLKEILTRLNAEGKLSWDKFPIIQVFPQKHQALGDFATNLPLSLEKESNKTKTEIMSLIKARFPRHPIIDKIDFNEKGFINFYLSKTGLNSCLRKILKRKESYNSLSLNFALLFTAKQKFTLQYAYARIHNLFCQLESQGFKFDLSSGLKNLSLLSATNEISLIKLLNFYSDILYFEDSDKEQYLGKYLNELANSLHNYYNVITLLGEDKSLSNARLCLLKAIELILQSGLKLAGLSTPESM